MNLSLKVTCNNKKTNTQKFRFFVALLIVFATFVFLQFFFLHCGDNLYYSKICLINITAINKMFRGHVLEENSIYFFYSRLTMSFGLSLGLFYACAVAICSILFVKSEQLNFLDVLVIRIETGKIITNWYRKNKYFNRYLNFLSKYILYDIKFYNINTLMNRNI